MPDCESWNFNVSGEGRGWRIIFAHQIRRLLYRELLKSIFHKFGMMKDIFMKIILYYVPLAIIVLLLTSCNKPAAVSDAQWSTWRAFAGNADSSNYSSLNQINKSNVSQLEKAWTFSIGKEKQRTSPIVIDGVMYITSNGGIVALDAATGQQLWFSPDTINMPLRGLAYWESIDKLDRRVIFTKGQDLCVIDAQKGNIISTFGRQGCIDLREGLGRDPESIAQVASFTPGRVYENLIIVGSSVGDESYESPPGDIRAYDVRTGEPVWTFHTVPHPGEVGYETWPKHAWKNVGGANAWVSLSIDEKRGIVYVPTGAPAYHFYGANRIGDNLFANSLIALDARTGVRLWHFQAVHHDIWDYDLAIAPKLLTVERNGKKIDAVAVATKHGFLFVFDRETGEPVFPIEERPVPQSDVPGEKASATQPYPVVIPPFAKLMFTENDISPYVSPEERQVLVKRIRDARNEGLFTPPSLHVSVQAPGSRGSVGNAAVDPEAGLFYIATVVSPTLPRLEPRSEATGEHFLASKAPEIFANTCAFCHGVQGQGQPPSIPVLANISERLSLDKFQRIVKDGRGRMPAFGSHIADDQIEELMAYLDDIDSVLPVESPDTSAPESTEGEKRYWSSYNHLYDKDGIPMVAPPWSRLIAYDLNQGTILWDKPYGDVIRLAQKGITGTGSYFPANSLVATAGGLLISTTTDRKIRAWSRDTGEVLWSADLPADADGGGPAVYEINGRQYIVAAATNGGAKSGQPFEKNAYVAFALPEKSN